MSSGGKGGQVRSEQGGKGGQVRFGCLAGLGSSEADGDRSGFWPWVGWVVWANLLRGGSEASIAPLGRSVGDAGFHGFTRECGITPG